MKMTRTLTRLLITALFIQAASISYAAKWQRVKNGKRAGISGIAPIEVSTSGGSYLIVHDNKKPRDRKLAIIEVHKKRKPLYIPVDWPQEAASPVDLESLTPYPGKQKDTYLAATSKGDIFHIELDTGNRKIKVLKRFTFPNSGGKNFEGFGSYEKNGSVLAVWAHRGGKGAAATLFWSAFDPANYRFSDVGSTSFRVPWPTGNAVRSISDLTIDSNGIVYISAASDPGDNGPFDSAVYRIGKIVTKDKRLSPQWKEQPEEVHRLRGHKVEGLVLFPGKSTAFLVGTDDENKGSSIRFLP